MPWPYHNPHSSLARCCSICCLTIISLTFISRVMLPRSFSSSFMVMLLIVSRRSGIMTVFERVDPTARPFDFLRQELGALFAFSQFQHAFQYIGKMINCRIQLRRCRRKTVRVDGGRIGIRELVGKTRDVDAHDIFRRNRKSRRLEGIKDRRLNRLARQGSAG